ncbi:MAG: hypothetical protein ABI462_05720 [Ignavibacteria bacterium]
MNWKIILLLVLIGCAVAVASLFGLVYSKYEIVYWLVLGLASGFVIARTCSRPFMHGVIVGLFTGILGSVIQAVFFDKYLMNNPASLDGFKNITTSLEPQYVLLFSGPFFGIAYGIVVGLIAFGLRKISGKKN